MQASPLPPFTSEYGPIGADKRQRTWAYKYKTLMNDPLVRYHVIQHQTPDLAFLEMRISQVDNKKVVSKHVRRAPLSARGTIMVTGAGFAVGTAHFMAYHFDGHEVFVYDPAPAGSTYGIDWKLRLDQLIDYFDGRKIIAPVFRHQHIPDDTWCQTWSAAWLDNSLRRNEKTISEEDSMMFMQKCVSEFVDRLGDNRDNFALPAETRHLIAEVVHGYARYAFGDPRRFYWFYDDRVELPE